MENNTTSFHVEYRLPPVNIIKGDEYLFFHEYEYICNEPTIKKFQNVYFNTEGYVYNKYMPIIEDLSINKTIGKNKLKNLIKCIFYNNDVINNTVFFIHDNWCEGYFHWNTDALIKLYNIIINLDIKNAKLIIPKHYYKIPFIINSLMLFGLNKDDLIQVELNSIYFCKNIFYCPPFTKTGNYHSELLRNLSAYLKKQNRTTIAEPYKYIYVSRKSSRKRKVINEAEIEETLKRYGFEIIETDNLSFSDQINLFNSAKWFISIHGAALTNIIFMNSNTNILEFREESDASNNCYFSLASAMSVNYYYQKCKRLNLSSDHVGDLYIDNDKLVEILDKYLKTI